MKSTESFRWLWQIMAAPIHCLCRLPVLQQSVALCLLLPLMLATPCQAQVVVWGDNYSGQTNLPSGLTSVMHLSAQGDMTCAMNEDGMVHVWGSMSTSFNRFSNITAIATIDAGFYYIAGLGLDGTVNNKGLGPDLPVGLDNVIAISAGGRFTMALRADGLVTVWGQNDFGQTNVPNGLSNIVAVSAGNYHSLALQANGKVLAWGSNNDGQTNVPTDLSNVVAIAAGEYHCLALKADGTVAAWGANTNGQANVPESATNVVAIAGGGAHSLALRADGRVIAWGANNFNQTKVPASLSNVVAIAAGRNHSGAVISGAPPSIKVTLSTRAVSIGGETTFLALVTGVFPLRYQWRFNGNDVPGATNAWFRLTSISPELLGDYSVTITHQGGSIESQSANLKALQVIGWGRYDYGQATVPIEISEVAAIAAGWYHNLVLRVDGTVVAWGKSLYGVTNVPPDLNNVRAIGGGVRHSVALRWDGTVTVWGDGTGLADLNNATAIAVGGYHNLALRNDGTVAAWDWNHRGQTHVPSGLSNVIAIAAGGNHSIALLKDGAVIAWGDNQYGQTNVPAQVTDIMDISGGEAHTLALRHDGTVLAWGLNDYGQCDTPLGLSNVVAISAGAKHSIALRSDGSVIGWGRNEEGQTNMPPILNEVVAISAGGYHNLALLGRETPPSIANGFVDHTGGDISFQLKGKPGWNYRVEYSTSLGTEATWVPLATGVFTNATIPFTDATVTVQESRFYRVVLLP